MMPRQVSIFVSTERIDMRRSFDGLVAAARDHLGCEPQSGALFLFSNRNGDRLKVLWWDRNGYAILYKRLERGTFRLPSALSPGDRSVAIDAQELTKILEGVELSKSRQQVRTAT